MENNNVLPAVESVMYEDKSGVVGWIKGERILVGNMKLMNRYHISIPTDRISSIGESVNTPTRLAPPASVATIAAAASGVRPSSRSYIASIRIITNASH